MNAWPRRLALLCLPCGAACGASIQPPESAESALHAEAAKVLAVRAPRYTGSGTKADALAFINSDVRPWLAARKAATKSLIARLEAARTDMAPGSPGVALLHADVANLLYSLSHEFVDAGDTCTPVATRDDAGAYRAYIGALVATTVPDLERAISEAQKCVATARPSELQVANGCQRIARDAEILKAKRGQTRPSLDDATRL